MKNKNKFIGVNFGGHDTSATLLVDDNIVAACEQERFDLLKHSRSFPLEAINECLRIGKISINDIDEISFGTDIFDLIREVYLKPALRDESRLKFLIKDIEKIKIFLNIEKRLRELTGFKGTVNFLRHHMCHLASTYYPSGFNNALVVSYDGMGEYETGMIGVGKNGKIRVLHDKVHYPHSLGLIYSAITFYLGWKHHCDEGIIMGLAPFGDYNEKIPKQKKTYIDVFRDIIYQTSPLNYKINLDYISYHKKRDVWISEKFTSIFGPKREYGGKITKNFKNIAAALQKRIEEVVISQLKYCNKKYNQKKLCISGGVGLNCSLNGKIVESKIFDEIFVQPASGDAGISYGAALLSSLKNKKKLKVSKNHNFYLGSSFQTNEILDSIKKSKQKFEKPRDLFIEVANLLSEGKIVAWFQGKSEFGPRALGNRSILSRPFPETQRDFINKKVKFRESFRPFAPAVLNEMREEFFEINQESPHMLIACNVRPSMKKKIPAVVHVDNSCRVQTVTFESNEKFYLLIKEFYAITKCPVLLNTSFNVKGQPIVNTPKQAIDCFLSTNLDVLCIGEYLLKK